MRLLDPELLALLILVPVLLYLASRRGRATIGFSAVGDLAALSRFGLTRLRRALPVLRALALVSFVVALARPQWGLEATKVYTEGIAIGMVVDISGSMGALDLQIGERAMNRLDVVKETFRAFVLGADADGELGGRGEDMISMVTFARYADSLSPLTLDHEALLALLDEVEIVGLPEEDGTAIGDAIVLGVDRLREAAGASRVMILLTDGSNNAGDTEPRQAAQIAKALGIKIYTIGTGTRGFAMMPAPNRRGDIEFHPAQVFIDEYTLSAVAELTGGRYFRATDSAALRAIYGEIDRLEKATNVTENYRQYVDFFALFVLLGLAFLLLETVLANTRLRTVP